jgi:AraC-like DNA-binding protein
MTGSDARSSDKPSLPHRWGEFQPRGTVRRNQRGNRHLAESARRRGWRRPSAEDTKMRTATEVDDYHVETWHELVGEYVRPMEPSPAPGQSFHAWMQVRRMGSIEVLEAGATPYVVHRSPTRECSPGQIFCSLQLSGPHLIAQDGQEILRRPGELAIFDPERPCTLVCREPVNFLAFVFPRQAVGSDLEALVKGAATVLPTGRGVGALLTSFLRQLAKQSGDVQSATAARLAGHTLDLLSTFFADLRGTEPGIEGAAQRSLILRIKAYIEENLTDPGLSPTTVAAAHHISVRYLQRLFEDQALTVSSWIRERRLEHARRDLVNPDQRGVPITVIADRWGFADSAHFSRVFKTAYGLSPRDCRHNEFTVSIDQ